VSPAVSARAFKRRAARVAVLPRLFGLKSKRRALLLPSRAEVAPVSSAPVSRMPAAAQGAGEWIKQNPALVAGAGLVALLLLTRKK